MSHEFAPTSISGRPHGLLWRAGNYLLILALFAATGGHWAVLQTIAWGGMLAENLQTDDWRAAVEKTFDGKHPCQLCHEISAGKKAEKKTPLLKTDKPFDLICERQAFHFFAPTTFEFAGETSWNYREHRAPPPAPPPRIGAA